MGHYQRADEPHHVIYRPENLRTPLCDDCHIGVSVVNTLGSRLGGYRKLSDASRYELWRSLLATFPILPDDGCDPWVQLMALAMFIATPTEIAGAITRTLEYQKRRQCEKWENLAWILANYPTHPNSIRELLETIAKSQKCTTA